MRPAQSRRRSTVRAVCAVVILAGSAALSVGAAMTPAAAAVPVDFTVGFPGLVPGETRTQQAVVTLERDATLERVVWQETTGFLTDDTLDVLVCSRSACTSQDAFARTPMEAGSVTVAVTVTAPQTVEPGARGAATGRLTFVAEGERLASTGSSAATALLWSGALLVAGGALAAVGAAGRRRTVAPLPREPR